MFSIKYKDNNTGDESCIGEAISIKDAEEKIIEHFNVGCDKEYWINIDKFDKIITNETSIKYKLKTKDFVDQMNIDDTFYVDYMD